MKKIVLLISFAVLFGVSFWYFKKLPPQSTVPLCKDCNIVILSLDTLSADHLPCMGYERNTAPNLCSFGKNNLFFPHAYANATYTLPTYVSLFTGVLPSVHGMTDVGATKLSPNLPFLPQLLKDNGYTTLFSLTPHNEHMPVDRVYNHGIDRFFDETTSQNTMALQVFTDSVRSGKKTFLFLHSYAVHPPYTNMQPPFLYTKDYFDWMILRESDTRDITAAFIRNMIGALDHDIRNGEYEKNSPHGTFLHTLESYNGNVQKQRDLILNNPLILKEYRNKYDPLLLVDVQNTRQLEFLKALYDQKIREADAGIVPLVTRMIADLPRNKKTLLLIMSDHGEEFGEHGYISHTTLYEPNAHVVLMMALPGIWGKTINTPVETIDIAPTILALVGIHGSPQFQGIDVSSAIRGQGLPERLLIAEWGARRTLRMGKWKLFYDSRTNTPVELYDIDADHTEQKNILFTNMDVARRIVQGYRDFEARWGKQQNN